MTRSSWSTATARSPWERSPDAPPADRACSGACSGRPAMLQEPQLRLQSRRHTRQDDVGPVALELDERPWCRGPVLPVEAGERVEAPPVPRTHDLAAIEVDDGRRPGRTLENVGLVVDVVVPRRARYERQKDDVHAVPGGVDGSPASGEHHVHGVLIGIPQLWAPGADDEVAYAGGEALGP